MAEINMKVEVTFAWWVPPFLRLCDHYTNFIIDCIDMEFEPNEEWIELVVYKGVRTRVIS